jgi:hypothetical protein
LGKADPGTEPGSGKAEPGPSYRCGLREKLEPISGKANNEESVSMKSPIDEGETEPMKEFDSVKVGSMIRMDWRLPLLECVGDPGKIMVKKVKWKVLKYTSLDDDLFRRTIDDVLLKCLAEEKA